jgi:hypothetical protein
VKARNVRKPAVAKAGNVLPSGWLVEEKALLRLFFFEEEKEEKKLAKLKAIYLNKLS